MVSEPIPVPIPILPFGGGDNKVKRPNINNDLEKNRKEQIIRIEIEDSEIIAIVELTLRNFII